MGAPADQYRRCSPAFAAVWSASPQPVSHLTADVGRLCPAVTIAAPPLAPADFRSTVEGAHVALAWDPVLGATGYELGAGFASGQADLARQTVSGTTFVVPNVPPGTYYVRVRALNAVGPGAPSEELVIVVP